MKMETQMNQKKYFVGIDIGTTKIVAVVGAENQFGKLEILGYGKAKSQGISRGMVDNILTTTKAIQQAVSQAQAKAGITITEAYVGIAGSHINSDEVSDYLTRKNPDQMITMEDMEMLSSRIRGMKNMFPGQEIIHIIPQKYKVDNQDDIREPIGMVGARLEGLFHIVTGQVTPIKNIHTCIANANIKLKGLTLEPIASAASVLTDEEKELGVALVDIGGGTTDLAIFKGGYIRYTAVIPFGGNVINKDIVAGCDVSEKHAESLKIKFGSAWPQSTKENEVINIQRFKDRPPMQIQVTTLANIIKCRMIEIIEAIFNEINNYGYNDPRKKLIAGIVLTGGGSELKDLRQLVEYVTGITTSIGLPNKHLANNTPKELESPIYATSIGLLLDAIENERAEEQRMGFAQSPEEASVEETSQELPVTDVKIEKEIEPSPIQATEDEKPEENKAEGKTFIKSISEKITDFFRTMN